MRVWQIFGQKMQEERGAIAEWVLVLLMSSALVIGVWTVASDRLVEIVSTALSNVCGGVGC